MIIDLRSDTVTKPTEKMLEHMIKAKVGDDVFLEDETVLELENKAAGIFGMYAGLFCPSGTMSNQIGIKAHTNPGDEVILEFNSHVYQYEGGGIAFNSGCSVRYIHGNDGRFKADDLKAHIHPSFNYHYPLSKLVVAENTCNRAGGTIWDFKDLVEISNFCKAHNLLFHMDGARIFNALVETGEDPKKYGEIFDSISICLSKGLGAPVGSVLLGSNEFIFKARRIRKVLGGGMRQAGYLAAAGIYALDHHVERLKEDHKKAKKIEEILQSLPIIEKIIPVQTNIVIFYIKEEIDENIFLSALENTGIKITSMGNRKLRMVTHLDITWEMMKLLEERIHQISFDIMK